MKQCFRKHIALQQLWINITKLSIEFHYEYRPHQQRKFIRFTLILTNKVVASTREAKCYVSLIEQPFRPQTQQQDAEAVWARESIPFYRPQKQQRE